ncbi:GMC oxidoreductase [Streptomyces sp. NPDC050161]|uniref:GMC oxidoreductase n=1 Tax=Streptomyces sp. NPDC050161 TaxID=3365604 RepID=UPI0037AD10F5
MGSRTGQEPEGGFDYDWVVIGSGFGGSVAALRLAERGYRVCVLEAGRRYPTSELPASTWNVRRYFWMPRLGIRGILRVSAFRDVSIISGAGVGGGSLVYAQTLYRAGEAFREHLDAAVGEHVDLDRYYAVAERMLGVVDTPIASPRDAMARAAATDLGLPPDRFHATRIGVFRGEAGVTVPDPYFGGEGPERTGCTDCGRCMVGCRVGAKNTLDKKYLWLAERRGVRIEPDREVTDLAPLGATDGSDGYVITARRPGSTVRRGTRVLRARGVVVAAGAVGTARLLAACRHRGSLPALSERLGQDVRTNAESICAITARDPKADLSKGVAISGSLQATDGMHLEPVGYGGAADSMGLLFVPLSGDGSRLTRPLGLLKEMLRHPVDLLRSANPRGWSRRSMLIGGMWTQDGALRFVARRRLLGRGVRLTTRPDPDHPNPTFLPEIYAFVRRLAEKYDAIPQIWATEPFNVPFTAHILGGAVIGTSPDTGVIDSRHRAFGYHNLLVTDGAAVPYNPGTNPSLTITALAERAMAAVPAKDGSHQEGGIGHETPAAP